MIGLLDSVDGVRYGPVNYKRVKEVNDESIEVDDIPFTKRWPYRCEAEFRIIWTGKTTEDNLEIAFDLRLIQKITISQRMPQKVYDTIRDYLRDVFRDPEKRISRSTLYENKTWINKFERS